MKCPDALCTICGMRSAVWFRCSGCSERYLVDVKWQWNPGALRHDTGSPLPPAKHMAHQMAHRAVARLVKEHSR